MKTISSSLFLFLLLVFLPFLISQNAEFVRFAEGSKRRIHVTDDLDDVIDDEEDDSWKEWGKKSTPSSGFDPPPSDFSNMDPSQIQAEMMKRQTGPVFGFVKLRVGIRRTPEMVAEIAKKWTYVTRTGAIAARFMGVDLNTLMFNMESSKDIEEMKEFILDQPEAYELKIGDQFFRRPGDPPLNELVERLNGEKNEANDASSEKHDGHLKEEL